MGAAEAVEKCSAERQWGNGRLPRLFACYPVRFAVALRGDQHDLLSNIGRRRYLPIKEVMMSRFPFESSRIEACKARLADNENHQKGQ